MKLLKKNGKFRKKAAVGFTKDQGAEVALINEGPYGVRVAIGLDSGEQVTEADDHSQVFSEADLREFAAELIRAADALYAIRSKG